MTTLCPPDGAIHDPHNPGWWWEARPLERHQQANSGLDFHGCAVAASIDGERLRVQHGENPEAVRWFTLDELNREGKAWDSGDAVLNWCDEIHRAGAAR